MPMLLDRAEVTSDVMVRDIMCPSVVRIRADATARQGAAALAYYGLTSLPVADRAGRVLGILSAGDILHLRLREPQPGDGASATPDPRFDTNSLDETPVHSIMLPVLFRIESTASLAELAHLFETTGADRVVVEAEGWLAGIVTTTDLLRALVGAAAAPAPVQPR
jgi:CBS-domain-containing membrane protein